MFCMVSFEKKNVSWHAANRESGPTAFQVYFQSLQILGKISSHILLEHSKFVEM